ncbi:MAG TPA: glycosyltransferase [Candidatus Baltobacteraceae bacterium]|nr:glycosyltransferase [Candidatus Baltobacteraceae bacterium]
MSEPQILHISTVHGPLDGRIYYKEVRSLHDAGFHVGIAGTQATIGEHDGVRILPLGNRGGPRWKRLGRDLRAMLVMLAHPNSILHIHDPELLLAALVPAYLGRTLVYDVHEFYLERIADSEWIPRPLRRALSRVYDVLERLALRRFAGVVIVAEAMRERYRELVGDDRVALVRNFPYISPAEMAAIRASAHPLGGTPYILHTGGASRLRAFHTMVAAAEYLRARGCSWPIVNLGPIDLSPYGEGTADLLDRAQRADVRNVGLVTQETAWSYVAHAAIGYMPLIDVENNARGMPNKLFENLMFGLPLVGMDLGNIAAIIKASGAGIVVPPEDANAHGEALLRLARDEGLRASFAANCAAAGARYSFHGELTRLTALYEHITDSARPTFPTARTPGPLRRSSSSA